VTILPVPVPVLAFEALKEKAEHRRFLDHAPKAALVHSPIKAAEILQRELPDSVGAKRRRELL